MEESRVQERDLPFLSPPPLAFSSGLASLERRRDHADHALLENGFVLSLTLASSVIPSLAVASRRKRTEGRGRVICVKGQTASLMPPATGSGLMVPLS